jgi:alpha-L-arabinofuranosidase
MFMRINARYSIKTQKFSKGTAAMIRILFTLFAFVLAHSASAQTVTQGRILSDQPGPVISRNIYGQFAEHLGRGVYEGIWVGPDSPIPNTRGIRNDVVAALKAIKVPVVRWPGGCFADEYHWRDGIGPAAKRPVRKNNWWDSVESNAFGTHEFMDFAQQIGADPYLSVNVASSNPTEMREWLEYLTSKGQDSLAQERRANGRDAPFPLPFIGIGNESWGCGGFMTPEYYANELRRFATFAHKNGTAFHNNADIDAVRVGSGANNLDTNWTDVVTKSAGPMIDAISLHYYTLHGGDWPTRNESKATEFPKAEWNAILYQAMRMDAVLKAHEAVLDKNDPQKRIALFVDEWGSWYAPTPGTNGAHLEQQNTLRDAVLAAATLNIFHAHAARVRMANVAQAVNVLQAMLLTDGAKMAKTPSYYVFEMYLPFQDATFIPVDVKAPMLTSGSDHFPAFNLTAARGKDGKLYIAVANMDADNAQSIKLTLGDVNAHTVTGTVLTHARMDAHNVPGAKEEISPAPFTGGAIRDKMLTLNIPAKSVVVLRLD